MRERGGAEVMQIKKMHDKREGERGVERDECNFPAPENAN